MGQETFHIAGIDPCRTGWAVVVARAEDFGAPFQQPLVVEEMFVAADFASALQRIPKCEIVCVYIPIGMTLGPQRACDVAARRLLGAPRASSVLSAPIRQCFAEITYDDACVASLLIAERGIGLQTFSLMKKIRQVEAVITPADQNRIREIHPEVSFYSLNAGKAVDPGKTFEKGLAKRRSLLDAVFANIDARMPSTAIRRVMPHDFYDALAAAWTAAQVHIGKYRTLPDEPQIDCEGFRMEIILPGLPAAVAD